jgi:hypothetical protein
MSHGQRGGSPTVVNLCFLDRNRYFFFRVAAHLSSQVLSGPRSRTTATQKIWQRRESNPEPLGLHPRSLTTRPQKRSVSTQLHRLLKYIFKCTCATKFNIQKFQILLTECTALLHVTVSINSDHVPKQYSHMYVAFIEGFGLVIRFIEYLQIATTSNYSAPTNSHSAVFYSTY